MSHLLWKSVCGLQLNGCALRLLRHRRHRSRRSRSCCCSTSDRLPLLLCTAGARPEQPGTAPAQKHIRQLQPRTLREVTDPGFRSRQSRPPSASDHGACLPCLPQGRGDLPCKIWTELTILISMVPTPQVCVSTLVTVSTMAVVDLYLLEQSMLGARGIPGPSVWQCAAVLLGDVGFLLALRFVSAGVVSEARSPRRGFANALWFLFLSLLQLKLFFVCHNYRQERRPPDPLARKTLTLLLSICLPSLFLILTGADSMTPQRRKQEVRSRLLWVVVDLLDVLDLQAGLWEAQGSTGGTVGAIEQKLPIWAEGLVFFYCYALLLLLPCVALTELGAAGLPGQRGARKEALYPWLSLVTINIFTLALRGTGMLWYRDPRVSTVFLGKNLLALAVKLSSAWERNKQERTAGGTGAVAGAEPGDSMLPSQSSEHGEGQAQGKAPPSHYHTLSHSQSHTLSHVSLEPTETPLGPSFISHEL